MVINVGANVAKLRSIAQDIIQQCDLAESHPHADGHPAQNVDVTIYAHSNSHVGREVTLTFNNDDMEGRDDLDADLVLVDLEED